MLAHLAFRMHQELRKQKYALMLQNAKEFEALVAAVEGARSEDDFVAACEALKKTIVQDGGVPEGVKVDPISF